MGISNLSFIVQRNRRRDFMHYNMIRSNKKKHISIGEL